MNGYTFSRLFARFAPEAFERCFIAWTRSLASTSAGRLVAVDGKALRRSFKRGWNKQKMTHLAKVEEQRQDLGDTTGKVTVERRCHITSLKELSAQQAGLYIRGHWAVENQLHWRLDVGFGEDHSRVRKDHGAENLSRLRRIAMNKLKSDPTQMSLKRKRYKCSLDRDSLLKMIQQ